MIFDELKRTLRKQHYAVIGEHSALEICRWNKKSLLNEGECYKQKFYGIKSHECCQMSPSILCFNRCEHCWRAIEFGFGKKISGKINSPEEIIDNCILAQRKQISGFKGNKKVNMKKWNEAQNPRHFAISLIGEPTIYPRLAEFILELRKRKITSFLVTNGLLPEKISELKRKKALPTQIYISFNYPNEELFRRITKNKDKNAWKKFLKSLEIMRRLKTRRVLRMTLVKDLNMDRERIPEYAKLINKAKPDFVEVKGYISVGFARKRLGYERMPRHEEIKDFGKLLAEKAGLKLLDGKAESKIVLLGKDKRKMKIRAVEI